MFARGIDMTLIKLIINYDLPTNKRGNTKDL